MLFYTCKLLNEQCLISFTALYFVFICVKHFFIIDLLVNVYHRSVYTAFRDITSTDTVILETIPAINTEVVLRIRGKMFQLSAWEVFPTFCPLSHF